MKKIPYLKSILFVLVLLASGISTIFASSWADEFTNNFIAYSFYALQVIAPIAFVGAIVWYAKTEQQD